MIKVLFIGDIYGNLGRKAINKYLKNLKREYQVDFCIVNGENAAAGRGITRKITSELYDMGVDCITMGNHTWGRIDIMDFIDEDERMVRPANYPKTVPGKGSRIITNAKNEKIGVVNVLGRVYMDGCDCPFSAIQREIEYLKQFVKVVIVDIHAEATSEKCAIAWEFDGRVSAVLGTHTHVQTADENIYKGMAYITDVGFCGASDGVIGMEYETSLRRLSTSLPERYEISECSLAQINGVEFVIDNAKATQIKRINVLVDNNERGG